MSELLKPSLIPELLVLNIDRSLAFWRDACGFEVRHSRPEEGFAYIALGGAPLMLEQTGIGRNWVTGPLEPPRGRGINFQITVLDAASLAATPTSAGRGLFMPLERKWYRTGLEEAGVPQFLITDPDGYLIRFQSSTGRRPAVL